MTQHFTRNTKEVSHWCRTCNRMAMHRVDDRRLGPCLEHQGKESKKQDRDRKAREAAEQNPTFEF